MSQQMGPQEQYRGYQSTYTPPVNDESDFTSGNSFSSLPSQKIGAQRFSSSVSSGHRLALAIVSVVMLVPLTAILLGVPDLNLFTLVSRVIALGLVCLTLAAINIAFNLRR